MNIKYAWLLIIFMQLISCTACTKNLDEKKPAPEFSSSIPEIAKVIVNAVKK